MDYLDEVNKKRQQASDRQSQNTDKKESIDAISGSSRSIVDELSKQGEKTRTNTQRVRVENTDLAKSSDFDEVVDSINKLNITTFMASKENWVDVVDNMASLSERMQAVVGDLNKNGVDRLEKGLDATVSKLQSVVDEMKSISVKSDKDVVEGIRKLSKTIEGMNVNPVVNVPKPEVTVTGSEVDLSPVEALLNDIKKQLKDNKVVIPKTDFTSVEEAVRSVRASIESLSFPVPNYVLPYKDPTTGKATQVTLTSDGKLPVDASVTATVDTTGLATDTNQTNGAQKTQIVDAGGEAVTVTGGKLDVNASASLAGDALPISGATEAVGVAIVDGSGNQITSFGGGTQYTEDDASASNPVGTQVIARRRDTLSSETTTDGDVTAVNSTAKGELYVKHVDSIPVTDNGGSITIDASSLPLPTGAATAAKQPALGTAGSASSDVITVQGISSMTALKVDGSAVTQPVSGTVTVNAGTNLNTSALALDAHLTDKSQFTKLTDGTDTALITAAGEQNVIATAQPGVDIGDVTINNASGASAVNIQDGGNSITVDGTVAATQSGSWSLAANQSVNVAQMNGVTTSMGVGASGTGVQRVVLANDQGKTLQSASGSASSSGNNTILSAGTNKLKIFAFTLSTTSTTAVTVKFQSGASGTDLWSVVLQAPSSVSTGANLAVTPPAYLFATASATLLNLNLSSANAVQWSVSYFDEA